MSKTRRPRTTHEDDCGDPLGKLIERYQVNLASVLAVAGAIGLVGLGAIAFALSRQPRSSTFLLAGGLALFMAFALAGINLFHAGRRLELRKHGVRFVESGIEVEFGWDEIADVEVSRLDNTNLGVVSIWKRSSDASSPSGLLTNTEFTVIIHSHDGRRIRLSPMFLRYVSNPKRLITQLRLRAGLR
jgi:hypothetical protein